MPITKDLGPFYCHTIDYRKKPRGLIERAYSQEIEGKYRRGYGLAIRKPFSTKGLVVGFWKNTGYNETQALTSALNAKPLIQADNDKAWLAIRNGASCLEDAESLDIPQEQK